MVLRIQKTLLEGLRQHGQETYPHECCGALVGSFDDDGNRTVSSVVRCGNMRTDSPQNRYEISPTELVRIQHEARMAGQDIVGFYHSHPDHPAQWSATDLEEAHWSGCSYVITRVDERKTVVTNSFLLVGDEETKRFEDEIIEIY